MPEKVVDILVTTPGLFSKLLTNSKSFIDQASVVHLMILFSANLQFVKLSVMERRGRRIFNAVKKFLALSGFN